MATTTSEPPTTAAVPAEVSSTVSSPPAGGGRAREQVDNAGLTLEFAGESVSFTLVDGSYQSGQDGDESRLEVAMLDAAALGDLDADGVGDAVIVLRVRRGISNDQDGAPDQSGGAPDQSGAGE